MQSIELDQTINWAEIQVGQIVARCASTSSIFERYGIDYCCGGKRTLSDVCKDKNIDIENLRSELLQKLEHGSTASDVNWNVASLESLCKHIISEFHIPLREQLAQMEKLASKVARVHGANHPEMVKVFEILSIFKVQLEMHMQKEEIVLFPSIVSLERGNTVQTMGCGGGIDRPISVMLQEHDDAGAAMMQMRNLTNNYTPPADACGSFRVLLSLLKELEQDMHEHVHLENNVLFPRALKVKCNSVCT